MKKCVILTACCLSFLAQANDSTGFVATGGVEYIKNDKIAMQSEDLFISQGQIKVAYQYKNLTDKEITETVLFPLSAVIANSDSDFADTKALLDSFKIWSDGKEIKPETHLRAFIYTTNEREEDGGESELISHDVTEVLQACGISAEEMQDSWTRKFNGEVEKKILTCNDPRLAKFNLPKPNEDTSSFVWGSQIIYSWQQTFKANGLTEVKHQYQPLVGGTLSLPDPKEHYFDTFGQLYCIDKSFKKTVVKHWGEYGLPYKELGYILTSGANWAKPIEDFTLTVERNKDEIVSFCWDSASQINKIKDDGKVVQFQVKEKNLLPKQDLAVIFVPIKSE